MNRYAVICRLRWPLFLLLTGVIALLSQAHILSWGRAWPLYLILWGVLALAERATISSDMPPPGYPYTPGYPTAGYAGQPGAYGPPAAEVPPAPPVAPAGTSIVPSSSEMENMNREPRKSWDEEGR